MNAGWWCNLPGEFLPEDAPPPEWEPCEPDDYAPYDNRLSFQLANLLYRCTHLSTTCIDDLLQIWTATLSADALPLFADAEDLYAVIDQTPLGDVSWSSFTVQYVDEVGDGPVAPWKLKEYEVWYHDPLAVLHQQLANCAYANELDFALKKVYDSKTAQQHYPRFHVRKLGVETSSKF